MHVYRRGQTVRREVACAATIQRDGAHDQLPLHDGTTCADLLNDGLEGSGSAVEHGTQRVGARFDASTRCVWWTQRVSPVSCWELGDLPDRSGTQM